jgi:hypothetical protein
LVDVAARLPLTSNWTSEMVPGPLFVAIIVIKAANAAGIDGGGDMVTSGSSKSPAAMLINWIVEEFVPS